MSFSRIQQFSEDVSVHQKLGDNPNTDNGLSSGELKALFDSPAEKIKEFVNQRVTPALLELEENADNVAAWRIETSNAINQVRSTAIIAQQNASQAALYAESADKRAKDAESLAQQATSTAAEARDSAATAAQDASDARDSASLAQASAESAQSSAEEAKNIANDADEKAQNAEASAQNAMDTAERAVQKSGDTMAGALSMGGNKLTGLPEPEDDADAVNLGKVRSLLASTPGTPGPYYTPSYSDLGNGLIQLSFDKSDSSLPDISPVTIQLPKGKDGDPGDPGKDGVTPNLLIGSVSTLPEGSQASAEITGTKENPVIHIGIPTGATGKPGKDAPVYYGDCPTAANVQAKVATTSATNITFGAILYAKFAYDNIAANPTLSAGGMRAPIVGTDLNPIAPSLLTAGLHQLYLLAYPDPEDETHGVTAWVLLTGAASGGSGGTSISIDTTLTQSGQAADAKIVGSALATRVPAAPLDSDAGKVATVGSDGIPRWETLPAVGSLFGRCSTAAHDSAKKATYIDGSVAGGTIITVEFVNANEAENPTLTANGVTGAIVGRTLAPISATSLTAGVHRFVCLSNYNKWMMLDAPDELEYIGEYTLAEDVATWEITSDLSGAPLQLRKMYFELDIKPAQINIDNDISNTHVRMTVPTWANAYGVNVCVSDYPVLRKTVYTDNPGWGQLWEIQTLNSLDIIFMRRKDSSSRATVSAGGAKGPGYITGLGLGSLDPTKAQFGAGSAVRIWGEKV